MTKYMNKVRSAFDNYDYPVFTLTDIRTLLSGTGISQRYTKILVNHLIKTHEIKRIAKGAYTFHDEIEVVGFAYRPFYYGLEDALSYRNFWGHATNPVVMTPNCVRSGVRKFGNANYIVKSIRRERFFGFDFIRHYDMWLPVSDPEKTLIDLLYYRHGVSVDAASKLASAVNGDRIGEYLKVYTRSFRKKVYAYLDSVLVTDRESLSRALG